MLDREHVVTKFNPLNTMRVNNMTLQELRLFSVYLSRINKNDPSSRFVHFHISELHDIFDIGEKVNKTYYENIAKNLMNKNVTIRDDDGFFVFALFSAVSFGGKGKHEWYLKSLERLRNKAESLGEFVKDKFQKRLSRVPDMDENDLYFTIMANNDAMPFLFDFKDNFFSYKLYNALNLKSKNQLRIYEILKQYAYIGWRIISVDELKAQIGIEDYEYPEYKEFKRRVLEPCQKAIDELTDISFTYEPHKKGARGKILQLKFNITTKKDFKDPLSLEKFMDIASQNVINVTPLNLNDIDPDEAEELLDAGLITKKEDKLIFLRNAVNSEFDIKQITILYDIVMHDMPHLTRDNTWVDCYNHFMAKYNYMKQKDGIKNPFGYMKSIIGTPLG
ncbi:MAG: replication initiation protein [Oscillospiraceae bacterium]|nr:replication initiation protein [Oscillospiraceae bacterium]